MTSERKKFTLKRKEIPIDIEDSEGKIRTYRMVEMEGTLRDRYMTDISHRMKTGPDGKPTGMLRDVTKLHSSLLNLCLFDDQNTAVTVDNLQKWPATVLSELYEMALDLNALREQDKEEEASKNG